MSKQPATAAAEPYTTVIGLEVHVQLQTHTKLFCGCSTKFGAPPNTQVCPTCLGLPGSLPVMNRRAFDLAVRAALALECQFKHRGAAEHLFHQFLQPFAPGRIE